MRRLFLLGLLTLLVSCARTYKCSNFDSIAKDHKVLAILPFDVKITPHRKDKTPADVIQGMEESEAFQLQDQFHMRLVRKNEQYGYGISLLEPNKINARLKSNSIKYESLHTYDYQKLCEVLEVDGVVVASCYRSKPVSDGAAAAIGITTAILFGGGIWASTNETDLTLKIFERDTPEMLWSYERTASGSVGSTPNKIAEYLARSVSRKFPYRGNI